MLTPLAYTRLSEYLPGRVKSVSRAWLNPPAYPTFLQIEPTQRCNLRCVMCGRTHFLTKPDPDMTVELFERIVSQFPDDLKAVHIQGIGEPLFNRDLLGMIQSARKRGLRTSFNTNFTYLTDEMAERLVELQHSEIQVSIETVDPVLFADLRRNASLSRVLNNIQRVQNAKRRANSPLPEIRVHAILMKHLLPGIPDMVKTLKEAGVSAIHFIDLITDGLNPSIALADGTPVMDMCLGASMSEESIWALIQDIKKLGDADMSISGPGDWGGLNTGTKQGAGILTCQELWERPFITVDGHMTPCCYMPHKSVMTMGCFQERTFEEIWFGSAYETLRRQHITNQHPPKCAACQQLCYTFVEPSWVHGRPDIKRRYSRCFVGARSAVIAPAELLAGVRAVALCRQVKNRVRKQGWKSGYVLAKCRSANLYIRRRNQSSRSARAECPICAWTGFDFLMLDCGDFSVPHVICPQCGGHERHRLLHLYLLRREAGFLNRSGRVLHFAPEMQVRRLIDRNPQLAYLSTDYAWHAIRGHPGNGFQSDMQHMPIRDASFDIIFCLHVLEHVPDDRQGVAEIHRILKPGGVTIIMVPFMMGWKKTIEFGRPDPAIFDHVRGYAPDDFRDRLSPFAFEEIKAPDFLGRDEIRRFRIPEASQVIFRCTKS